MIGYRQLSSYLPAILLACLSLPLAAQTNLGSVNVGSSTTVIVTLTILSAATLGSISVRTQGAENLDFTNAGGGTCTAGAAYLAGATCTVNVTFMPSNPGPRNGAVVLLDSTSSKNTLATRYMLGTGQGAQIVYPPWGTPQDLGPVPVYPPTDFNSDSSNGGLAIDGSGNIYVASQDYGLVAQSGVGVTKWTLSNGSYTQTVISSTGGPGMAVDGGGNLYYACGSTICKAVPLSGGTYRMSTISSGFSSIFGVAVDGMGNVYVADNGPGVLWKETLQPNGNYLQSEIASGLNQGGALGYGPTGVSGVAVDGKGNVYVSNQSATVYKESPSGGGYTQTTVTSSLQGPVSVAVDGIGNVYVADENYFYFDGLDGCTADSVGYVGSPALLEEMPQSGGAYFATSLGDPIGLNVYSSPNAVALDAQGNLYFADSGVSFGTGDQYGTCTNVGELYRYAPNNTNPPSLSFGSLAYGSTSSPQVVTLSNSGNAALTFSAITFPADFARGSAATTECKVGTSVAPGRTCTISVDFKPVEPFSGGSSTPLSESVSFKSNSLIGPEQSIAVFGTERVPTVETPVFSLPSGTYNNIQTVTITDATAGAVIHYSLNGSTPTAASTKYTGPVAIRGSYTLQAIAMAPPGSRLSPVGSAHYALEAATPVVSLAGGIYTGPQIVTITTASTAVRLYYTTNGSTPTYRSTLYAGPITVSASETLKVIAAATGYTSSAVVTNVYTIH